MINNPLSGNISEVHNPELIFGILGPIGTPIEDVVNELSQELSHVGYSSEIIHLTALMRQIDIGCAVDENEFDARYESLIKYADTLRERCDHDGALAGLAITEIQRRRELRIAKNAHEPQSSDTPIPALATAYIIRQLKTPGEVEVLRSVYGKKFVLISVYCDITDIRKTISNKMRSASSFTRDDAEYEKRTISLIDRDSNERTNKFGQKVSEIFHLADVFVDGRTTKLIHGTISRFIKALFGYNGTSPTRLEYGMYAAKAASLRSIDLSRQVGASIFSEEGELITQGCNEVPKPFGGTYWHDDDGEAVRDFELGHDPNHQRKEEIVHDFLDRLFKENLLTKDIAENELTYDYVRDVIGRRRIKDSQLMDIIEFGRIIHAEMCAITDAARLGRPLKNSVLYCTTFPCHMCAKHIVSSGVKRVVFLEPYPKSYARKLHDDSITFNRDEQATKVFFEPFIGISPSRYKDIFEKGKRKGASGKAKKWYYGEGDGQPRPQIHDLGSEYLERENPAIVLTMGKLSPPEEAKRQNQA
ncbi:anti-phage dCTP deaminase [Rhizobium leguminosarum]|uniref:anti-phage dCTP deaminase n=1 Tax=Rhizobium leguminosarum TaxID=384 RepID=UPI001FE085E9|nr:anti-phage dCTP deaminase [Rhizobium leguminosarum]